MQRFSTFTMAAWLVTFALVSQGIAAEYFVTKQGDDSNDGRSRAAAFATIQQGVDALEPGDTLTIDPGQYHEAVTRENLGSDDAPTTIRAAIPGTVLLRGDVDAPDFEPVDGYRYVYQASFDQPVQAVNEADTLRILEARPNIAEVEFNPGTFHYDTDAQTLYISATDMRSPEAHHYTVSVLASRGGIFLQYPKRVVIDGLAATGYHRNMPLNRMKSGISNIDVIPWGFYLWNAKDTVVRNCTAYLNAGGIGLLSRDQGGNLIEHATAYGNYSQFGGSGGNILGVRVNHDTVRHSYTYRSRNHGIRYHTDHDDAQPGDTPVGYMHDNLSWGQRGADLQIKGVSDLAIENVVVLDTIATTGQSTHSILRDGHDHPTNIMLTGGIDMDREFADAVNLDFRLQADSQFRGAGPDGSDKGAFPYEPNIYYVSPEGNDSADGLSTRNAWRTLQRAADALEAGDTLYLEPGVYAQSLRLDGIAGSASEPIHIRGRGRGHAVIRGAVRINQGGHITLQRLNFADTVTLHGGEQIHIDNCQFTDSGLSLKADALDGLRLTHNVFTRFDPAAVDMNESSGAFLSGNIFDNPNSAAVRVDTADAMRYSDYNSYANAQSAWHIDGQPRALGDLPRMLDRHAKMRTPDFHVTRGVAELNNPLPFAVGGPHGTALGNYRERQRFGGDETLRIDGPVVHSTTATTANIEWWSSHPAVFRVHWGPTPEMSQSETLTAANAYHPANPLENFNTFSLNGLEPDTTYYYRIEFVGLAESDGSVELAEFDDAPQRFTTAAYDPDPRTLHVAADGDNANTGLSRAQAWRSLTHAANQARPGDTVLVGEGVYHETVRIRTTGDKGKPVTFKAAPGEKVVLDGDNRTLQGAFWAFNNKDHLNFDGFYLQNFLRGGPGDVRFGAIALMRSDHIQVTRIFHDGRQAGSAPELLTASHVNDLLVKNCVFLSGWDGIGIGQSENVRIENNVLIRPSIRTIPISGDRDEIHVRSNIISDNLRGKRGSFLVPVGAQLENNAYFLRWPEEERSVFGRDGISLAQYNQQNNVARANITADPQLAGVDPGDGDEPVYFSDAMIRAINDFPDAFTTNPELRQRGIGLIPEDFADFHFHADRDNADRE